MTDELLPPPDDELPLPPQEPEPPREPEPPQEPGPPHDMEPPQGMAREPDEYPDIKVKKSGPLGTMRRAVTIFEKDLRTMAKHGLISSIIVAVFLGIVFSIASYSMSLALSIDFGDGEGGGDGGGDDINLPGATESVDPVADAGSDRTVDAGTVVTLDGSGSTDNAEIVYYSWRFEENFIEVELYGEVVTHRFMAAGEYNISLTVVDSSWNMDEADFMLRVESTGTDTEYPTAAAGDDKLISAGTTVVLDGSNSTDNVGIVNWTWSFYDIVSRVLYGETVEYTFMNANNWEGIWGNLVVRDDAGNVGMDDFNVIVNSTGEDFNQPSANFDTEFVVTIGTTVTLDASSSFDYDSPIADYSWYVKHNATKWKLSGQVTSFVAEEWGPYEIILAVRDASGNTATTESTVVALPEGFEVDQVSWTATPLGQDVSFNLLTYAYGMALLTSVIFVGGLFAKGFVHEIQKGTIKVLFFGPVSVTSVVFSKLLYPIVIGPLFIFPLVFIGMLPFHQSMEDTLTITAVSYMLTVLMMVSAAYGSCLIYRAAKRMVLKPTVLTRVFMYLSLVGTMTVFEWLSFLMDMRLGTEQWGDMYLEYGPTVAMFSPFHQGGALLSDLILGSGAAVDWWVFIIPAVLIAGGVVASRKLYPDLFARE